MIIVAAVLGASGYGLRRDGLFSCQASGYASDHYLAYCQATRYGDYDYGAFWFGLEPAASAAATAADVLFIGDSRMQFGLSTDTTAHWFESRNVRYFLLGFAYDGNVAFEGPLIARLNPQARVYVINVDRFFDDSLPQPAKMILRDSSARTRYVQKQIWQGVHAAMCLRQPSLCGHAAAFFRSRTTGMWTRMGGRWTARPVAYVDSVDQRVVDAYAVAGRQFLSRLPVSPSCVLLTNVPKGPTAPGTGAGTAKAVAAALGLTLVAPQPDGLSTFDGSHLDYPSAARWAAAFLDAAGPRIEQCLAQRAR